MIINWIWILLISVILRLVISRIRHNRLSNNRHLWIHYILGLRKLLLHLYSQSFFIFSSSPSCDYKMINSKATTNWNYYANNNYNNNSYSHRSITVIFWSAIVLVSWSYTAMFANFPMAWLISIVWTTWRWIARCAITIFTT